MRSLFPLPLCFLFITALGCRSQQLASDQDKFRCKILDMYTDQIMDNLIRTDQGLPIVQMDYTNVTGTITQNATAGVSDGYTSTYTNTLAGVVQTITHTFTNVFNFSSSTYQTNALSVTANPLINNNEVYNSYIRFVHESPCPLVKTCDPPPEGAAHIVRKCGKVYYWIPTGCKDEFFRLALATTVMRPTAPPDKFENTVVDVLPAGGVDSVHKFTIQFKTTLKSGTGTMDAVINGVVRQFPLYPYSSPLSEQESPQGPTPQGPTHVLPGADTTWFTVIYDQKRIPVSANEFIEQVKGQPVKIDLDFFKPTSPTTQVLNSIDNNTQLLRIQNSNH